MAATQFLHGAELIEISTGTRTIKTANTGVIGIVGTAPNALPETKASYKYGIVAANNALTITSKLVGNAGNTISLALLDPKANNAALSINVAGRDISATLATSAMGAITTTAAQLLAALAANPAANALISVANTATSSGAGVISAVRKSYLAGGVDEAFPLNKPVLIAGSTAEAAKLGVGGTLPDALKSILDQTGAIVIVIRVAAGADDIATTANVIGGTDAMTGQYQGCYAFLGCESVVGYAPRILIAPGFTHQRTNGANLVVSNLVPIADRLRAVIVADGPSTNDSAAIAYAGDFGSRRIYLVDPRATRTDSNGDAMFVYSSAIVAGLIAKSDNERGFWYSPSNQEISGISGTERPIDFAMGDPASRANLLNENRVATIIRQSGFRLWGNYTLSSDPRWQFLCVLRTADAINDAILRAHLWAVDQGITKAYETEVSENVRAYLRDLVKIGAIIGGDCWPCKELNTPEQIAQGNVYFDFDFTPVYPAQRVTFRSRMHNGYLSIS